MFFRLFALSLSALSGCVGFSEITPIETVTDRDYPKLLPIDRVITTSTIPLEPSAGQYLLQRSAQLKKKRDALNTRAMIDGDENS
tara:strand:+ start:262 stop:516 length:255 start_codon:yes stop_codon:yes gene_type:complete